MKIPHNQTPPSTRHVLFHFQQTVLEFSWKHTKTTSLKYFRQVKTRPKKEMHHHIKGVRFHPFESTCGVRVMKKIFII